MNNLYDVLEICLQDIEQGAEVETVLFRYPDLADELRPILEASAGAKNMAIPVPSSEVIRRNRAKVLQYAAQMREAKVNSSRRTWFASLRRVAVTLAVVTMLFVSGTGLVGASSNTLPGDNLYPVKRTWEGLRLFFAFNSQVRDALEVEHENERLHELQELLAEGRSEEVDFNGRVEVQNGNDWIVAGVRVLITDQTEVRDPMIVAGNAVRVRGVTQADGTIWAERIRLLSSDDKLPDVEDEHEAENGNDDNSGHGSGDEQPQVEETRTPEPENDNSGNDNDADTNDNLNENDREDSDSKDNTTIDNNNDSNDNSGSDDNGGSNDDGNDSGGGNDDNDNGDDSGGGDNSGSGGGGDDGGGDD
jgi:uncharacterized membrane protein YgcG